MWDTTIMSLLHWCLASPKTIEAHKKRIKCNIFLTSQSRIHSELEYLSRAGNCIYNAWPYRICARTHAKICTQYRMVIWWCWKNSIYVCFRVKNDLRFLRDVLKTKLLKYFKIFASTWSQTQNIYRPFCKTPTYIYYLKE